MMNPAIRIEERTQPRRLPLVSTSELTAFRRCAREHHIRYRLGYRPLLRNLNLRFGTLVHRGLEAWWRAKRGGEDALAWALTAIDPQPGEELDDFELARAEVMLAAYDQRWSDVEMEVLGVEVWFRADIVNPETGAISRTARLVGKMDAIVRIGGRIYVVEHKTASGDIQPGTPYWKRLRMDPQVSLYVFGLRTLAEKFGFTEREIGGCLYDVLAKPSQAPAKATPREQWQIVSEAEGKKFALEIGVAEKGQKWGDVAQETKLMLLEHHPHLFRLAMNQRAEDETVDQYRERLLGVVGEDPTRYFQRGEVVRFEEDERDAAFDLWQQVRAMRENELAGRAPRNPDACIRYGSECDFFAVCSRETTLEDQTRFELMPR